MTNEQSAELIYPPNTLKAKVGGALKGIDMDAIQRAEQALADMQDEMQGWLNEEIERLQAARQSYFDDAAAPEKRQALFTCAHDLKGLGTTYSYPLVTRVAGSFCQLLQGVKESSALPGALVDGHVDAICFIVRESVQDADDPRGKALAGELEKQVITYLATHSA